MNCELCKAKKTLKDVMFIGSGIFVIRCKTCGVPMAVSLNHKSEFDKYEKSLIIEIFYKILKLQGKIDWRMRKIPEHVHAHLRPEKP